MLSRHPGSKFQSAHPLLDTVQLQHCSCESCPFALLDLLQNKQLLFLRWKSSTPDHLSSMSLIIFGMIPIVSAISAGVAGGTNDQFLEMVREQLGFVVVNGAVAVLTYVHKAQKQIHTYKNCVTLETFQSMHVDHSNPTRKIAHMSSPLVFYELKKQVSSFLKEKVKTARLALTDVTPAELMAEEATNENPWPPDTRSIGVISRAAFEVDDYCRIVDILHKRLLNFNRQNWRGSYKALILLEHLLCHGPLRIAEEFEDDKDLIKEMRRFQYIDEKGFNWGLSLRKLSERVLKLVEDEVFFREERARARNLTRGIEEFGSLSLQRSSFVDSSLKDLSSKTYERCNSHYNDHQSRESKVFGLNRKFVTKEEMEKPQKNDDRDDISKPETNPDIGDHPFCQDEHQTAELLLSSVNEP